LRSKISFVTSERSLIGNNSLDTVSNVINVLGGNTADRDSSVLSHVNVMLLNHSLGLLNGKSGEREHTNLGGDMSPISFGNFFEVGSEELSHLIDSICDGDKFIEPLLSHDWITEDHSSDSGTVLWWGRVVGSNNKFKLGKDSSGNCFVCADEMECTGSLTIKTHDFSE